jgi:hypothetical protein
VLAYLRGDSARLDADVDVSEVLRRIDESGVAWVHTQLATAKDVVATSVESYRNAVDSFADRIAAGTLPDTRCSAARASIPCRSSTSSTTASGRTSTHGCVSRSGRPYFPATSATPLIDATTQLIAGHAADATTDLRASLEDRRDRDVVTEVADRAGRSRAAIVGQLNSVRDAASWLGPPTAAAGVALMSGAVAGIAWLNRRQLRRAGFLLAAAAIASGVTIVLVWAIVQQTRRRAARTRNRDGPGFVQPADRAALAARRHRIGPVR